MASEKLCPNYLSKLSDPSKFAEEIDDILPALLTDLERNSASSYFPQVLTSLLGPVFKEYKIEDVESRLLQHLLPCLGRIFSQSLSSMVDILKKSKPDSESENVFTVLNSFSQVCLHILSGFNDFLCNLLSYETIAVNWVMSFPRNVSDILLAAFTHCSESESLYQTFFSTFSEFLTTFFRQSYEVQTNFFRVLENILIFNCSLEDELSLLTDVLETMSQIGEIVVRLDTKTMADQWKIYAKLAHKYANALKPRLNIAHAINFLAGTLQETVLIIVKQPSEDKKTQNRNIKLGSFILKIIIKFCEDYEGYLGDCHRKILELLITLNGITSQDQNETVGELEQYITVGAGPLLRHVIGEVQFTQEFSATCSAYKSLTSEAKLGLLLLLLSILKKLVTAEAHVTKIWWDSPIFENIFNIYSGCWYEMDINLKVDGLNPYTCLVSRTAAIIVSNETVSHFPEVEKLLVSKLLQPDLYQAIFAQDLLCLLARLMTGEVCAKQALYLSGLIANWPIAYWSRPELMFIGTTIFRIFPLLSSKSRTTIFNKYPPQEVPLLWHFLGFQHLTSPSTGQSLIPNALESLNQFNRTQSLLSYNDLMKVLYILPDYIELTKDRSSLLELSHSLMKTWSILKNSLHNFEQQSVVEQPVWWCRLFNQICRSTTCFFQHMNNKELLEVVLVMMTAASVCVPSCKMSILSTLKVIGVLDLKADDHFQNLSEQLGRLYARLMEDDDPLVKQMAMESFSNFAYITKHEHIVISTVSDRPFLQKTVAQYLQELPTVPSAHNDIKELLVYSDDTFSHKCQTAPCIVSKNESYSSTDKVDDRPTKKLKKESDEGELETAVQLLRDLTAFNNRLANQNLSQELKNVCCGLFEQFEHLKRKL